MCGTNRRVKNLSTTSWDCHQTTNLAKDFPQILKNSCSTPSSQQQTWLYRYWRIVIIARQDLPLAVTVIQGVNLGTSPKEPSLVSKTHRIVRANLFCGRRGWKWTSTGFSKAASRACLEDNIMSNPIVTVAEVFVTTIIGNARRNSLQN